MSYEQQPRPEHTDDKDAKFWATVLHLTGFMVYTGIPFAGIFAPITVWLFRREYHPFIDAQGREVISFQINLFLYYVLLMVAIIGLFFSLDGIFLIPLIQLAFVGLVVMHIVCTIIASIRVSDGKAYRYPLNIRWL